MAISAGLTGIQGHKMATISNNYYNPGQGYDPGAAYANAGQNIAEALFGNPTKAGDLAKQNAETQLLVEKVRAQQILNAAGGPKKSYSPAETSGVPALVSALYASHPGMEGFNLSQVVPPEKLLEIGKASDEAYSKNRSQYEAAQAMADALGPLTGAHMQAPVTHWFSPNEPAALLDANNRPYFAPPAQPQLVMPGSQASDMAGALSVAETAPPPAGAINGTFPYIHPSQMFNSAPAAPAQTAPVGQQVYPSLQAAQAAPVADGGFQVLTPQQAAGLPPGTKFIGTDGQIRTKR